MECHFARAMKKRILSALALLVLLVVPAIVTRPPRRWSVVTVGMQRQEVYAKLGRPAARFEQTKGAVRWRRELLVGKWEFDVAFRADDTVGMYGPRWRWSW